MRGDVFVCCLIWLWNMELFQSTHEVHQKISSIIMVPFCLDAVCCFCVYSFFSSFFFDNSMVTTGEGGFEPWMSQLETLGGAYQLSYKTPTASASIVNTVVRIILVLGLGTSIKYFAPSLPRCCGSISLCLLIIRICKQVYKQKTMDLQLQIHFVVYINISKHDGHGF